MGIFTVLTTTAAAAGAMTSGAFSAALFVDDHIGNNSADDQNDNTQHDKIDRLHISPQAIDILFFFCAFSSFNLR